MRENKMRECFIVALALFAVVLSIMANVYGEAYSEGTPAGPYKKGLAQKALKYAGGSGVEADPFQLSGLADWLELTTTPVDWDKHFVLTGDIDFDGVLLTPTGNTTTLFKGSLDGNDHVLRNIVLQWMTSENVGLFGYIGNGAVIHNLGIENITVSGHTFVGGLAGRSIGQIALCHVSGVVSGNANSRAVGGLVGINYGRVTSCYTTDTVTGYEDIGGMAGINMGAIEECHTTGSVTGDLRAGGLAGSNSSGAIVSCYASGPVGGQDKTGGLVGQNDPDSGIQGCYAQSTVTGNLRAGGLVGANQGAIDSCYARSAVNNGSILGGLAGVNGGAISFCHAEGTVTGDDSIGGLVGRNESSISYCYALVTATAEENAGGLAGGNFGSIRSSYARGAVSGTDSAAGLAYRNEGAINECYATGLIRSDSAAGGLVVLAIGGTTTSSYWNVSTSGVGVSAGGEPRTTEEMLYPHATNTFEGWNFTETWAVDVDYEFNDGYPYLLGNVPPVDEEEGCGCLPASCDGEAKKKSMKRLLGDWLLIGLTLIGLAVFSKHS